MTYDAVSFHSFSRFIHSPVVAQSSNLTKKYIGKFANPMPIHEQIALQIAYSCSNPNFEKSNRVCFGKFTNPISINEQFEFCARARGQ